MQGHPDDIAFSYLVARIIFGAKHPGIPFLLLLAIADDALGLMILAVFYPSGDLHLGTFAIVLGAAMVLARWLRSRRTLNFWPYVVGAGTISWLAFYWGGLHPALALVPIVPFVPHASRDAGLFVERPHALTNQHIRVRSRARPGGILETTRGGIRFAERTT